MKRLLLLALSAIMLLTATACGETKYASDELAIYDTITRQYIKIGDSEKQVEKILGTYYDDDGLGINYDDEGNAEYIRVFYSWADDDNRYELPRGINFDSVVTDFFDKYPEAVETEGSIDYVGVVPLKEADDGYYVCSLEELKENAASLSDDAESYAYISIEYSNYESIDWITVSKCPYLLR